MEKTIVMDFTEQMVHLEYKIDKDTLKLAMKGRLDVDSVSRIWPEVIKKLADIKPSFLEIDAAGIEYCDGAGAALLLQLKRRQEKENHQFSIKGLKQSLNNSLKYSTPAR